MRIVSEARIERGRSLLRGHAAEVKIAYGDTLVYAASMGAGIERQAQAARQDERKQRQERDGGEPHQPGRQARQCQW